MGIELQRLANQNLVSDLDAYKLKKFEQQRSVIYIYDLAVCENYRRRGIATSLIEYLKSIAREAGAWVILVRQTAEMNHLLHVVTNWAYRKKYCILIFRLVDLCQVLTPRIRLNWPYQLDYCMLAAQFRFSLIFNQYVN